MENSVACGCIGPQNGEPLCPCRMKNVIVQNGRYKLIEDLGPAKIMPDPPEPPPCRIMKERWLGGLYETEESKQATRDWYKRIIENED